MMCLRRTALRVLSSTPSVPLSIPSRKARSITRLAYPISIKQNQTLALNFLQRRNYADEAAATQSEPVADGATHTQHGENSIAASADPDADATTPMPVEDAEASEAASEAKSATERATDSVRSAAQTASETVTGATQSLADVAGMGSQAPNSGINFPQTSNIVYVGNLFFDVKENDLKNEFGKAGRVLESKIIVDARGLSKGFGYVTFETVEAAQRAIDLYNLQNFEGRRLSVQFSQTGNNPRTPRFGEERPKNAPTKTLFIGNMSFDMSDRDLNNLFREIKNVIDVRVAIDRRTGQPRGFAHADFVDIPSAERAMAELSGKVVSGRPLRVDFSTSTGRAAVGAS